MTGIDLSLLRWIDAGPYHARRRIPKAHRVSLVTLSHLGMVRKGRFGTTVTTRGSYALGTFDFARP